MASYKVPQDVEADDKLIGPFSFRQFIYLIVVAISMGLAWGLSQLFIPLAIVPLPLILFFGALALPLRKDQPMEVYLAALVSFYLKPRNRLWVPDGVQSLVEITAPKTIEIQRTKGLSQDEAELRLSYLAQVVDTRGWAVRGVAAPETNSAMNDELYFEAQQTTDMLDTTTTVGRTFDTKLAQADQQRRQEMVERMHQAPAPTPTITPSPGPAAPQLTEPHLDFNPYPNAMHQSVIQPLGSAPTPPTPAPNPPQTSTSEKPPSPDIINLANNTDLSIETIAHEANRIKQKQADEEEVVISLR